MPKTYAIPPQPEGAAEEVEENKLIVITETQEVQATTTVAALRSRHATLVNQINTLKVEADKIANELITINADEALKITVSNIPEKLITEKPA